MNAQDMNSTRTDGAAESVAEGVKKSDTPMMTKEEAQQQTDAELLQMIQQAQGHTGKDFKGHMNCDFSYSYLTGLLRERGYENGWYKASEGAIPDMKPSVVRMKKPEEHTTRKSFIIDRAVAEKWKDFNKNIPFPSVALNQALQRFMDDYHSGRITFELEI